MAISVCQVSGIDNENFFLPSIFTVPCIKVKLDLRSANNCMIFNYRMQIIVLWFNFITWTHYLVSISMNICSSDQVVHVYGNETISYVNSYL